MVLQKRRDFGFNRYQLPYMSHGSRLAKRKRSARKRVEENQMCAFDLLATVAGRLLLERESSPLPKRTISGENLKSVFSRDKIKVEEQEEMKPCDQRNLNGSTRISKIGFQQMVQIGKVDQCLHASGSMFVRPCSTVMETGPLKGVTCAGESVFNRNKSELDQRKLNSIGHCPVSAISYQGKLEDEFTTPSQSDCRKSKIGTHGNVKDPMEIDVKPCMHGDNKVHRSSKCEGDIEFHVDENDDGRSLGSTLPCNVSSKRYRRQCIGDRRIRKLLASKVWKLDSMHVKDGDISNSDEDLKSVFYNKKARYLRQRSQKSVFKRRRVSGQGSRLTYNGLLSHGLLNHESISHLPERSIKEEANSSPLKACGGIGTSSSTDSDSVDFPVKLSIKSFKVPELFIEVPETATVGTLKRAVMEAVSAIFGGGLGIGVLLEGKKVRDDSKTLLQAGISYTGELDGLGFTLEPADQQLKRLPEIPASDTAVVESPAKPQPPPITTSGSRAEGDQHRDLFHPNTGAPADEDPACSKALVALPAVDAAKLAPGPKSRRAEAGQRRVRRPFSVSEVEALVEAVEKLGTGRWRDVKLRAFEDADHRTYVDLKDKWKTLVHTARISPQRRRGEPVPQGLLDRVLSAHANWSQQQTAKLQVEQPDPCLLAGGSSARSASPPPPP